MNLIKTLVTNLLPSGASSRGAGRTAGFLLAWLLALPQLHAAAPGSPTAVSADASDSSAVVSFTAPVSDGGSSIRYYEITTVESPGLKARGRRGPITVLGLTNGTLYTFVVTATNADGTSAASVASAAVTPGRIQFGHGHWALSGSQDFKGASSGSLSSSSGSAGSGYTGTSAGWTLTSKINPGMQSPAGSAATATTPPTALAHLALTAGGDYLVALIGGTALSITDPGTDSLQLPIFGTSSLLLNDTVTGSLANGIADTNGGHGQNAIVATKTFTVSAGEVDPLDGQVHVRLATAPVVVNPAHAFNEQPYQFVQIENLTLGTTVYTDLNVAGAVGVPWITSSQTSGSSPIQYTTWQLVDWTGTNSQIGVGDQIKVTIVTASCSKGGHWGRAYAAPAPGALGNAGTGIADFPTAYVTATGPAAVAKASDIGYTFRYRNLSGSNIDNVHVQIVIPVGTTYVSTTAGTSSYIAGTTTLNVTLGSMLDGDYGSFDVVVNSGATVGQVTLGNYILTGTLAGTTTPILPAYGSKVYTTIDDLYTVTLNSNNGAGGSVVSTPDVGSLNFGATTSAQSVVKGRTASLTASPSAGYQFTGWTGAVTSASATISVTVNSNVTLNAVFTPLNTPPVVTTTSGTTAAVEQVAIAVDSTLTVADSDSATLASATVSVTGNFQSAQDVLAFTNNGSSMGNISASYSSGTGVLTLTSAGATATPAHWQVALRAVTYTNSSDTPNTSNRTVTFVANDGTLASNSATKTLSVAAVNDAPVNTVPGSITVTEDQATALTGISVADADAGSSTITLTLSAPTGTLSATSGSGVNVTGSGTGTLVLSGAQSAINAFIAANGVSYTTPLNANGSVTLTVTSNDGGNTGSGGTLTDTDTVTLNITAVNDAPVGTPKTITSAEDTDYTFAASDFGFTDPNDSPANSLHSVRITTLATAGTLKLSGTPVTAGQFVPVASIPNLTFTPVSGASGTPYASFSFNVKDNGGTSPGVDTDTVARTITFNITSVSDAPIGTPRTITTSEDTDFTFAASDFGFTDPNDSPANNFHSVKVTTLPAAGTLKLSGTPVTAGQFVPVASITNLKFTPVANANGTPYTSFTFQVKDDGGTSPGVDTDVTPRTMTISVTPVNDAPVAGSIILQKVVLPASWTLTFPAFTDVDDVITFYTVTGLPPGITFDAATRTLSGKPTTAGTYTIAVRGTDPQGAYDTLTIILTVELPPPPVATADTASAKEAGGVSNQTPGLNPAGNVLANDTGTTLRVSAVGGTAVTATGTMFYGRYGHSQLTPDGGYTYTVDNSLPEVQALNVNDSLVETLTYKIADEYGRTADASLTITITGADDAPVPVTITPPAGTVGRAFGPLTFAPFTDVDNTVVTYTVTGLPPGITFDPATRTFSGTPTEFGPFTVTVTGSDGVLSATTSFTLRVSAPPVNTLPNGTITVRGDPVRFVGTDGSTFKVTDPDSTDLTVRLTVGVGLLTLPQRAGVVLLEGAAINDQTVVIRGPLAALNATLAQLVYQAPTGYIGTDTITIVSTDEQGNSDTDVTTPPISIVLSTLGGNDAAATIGSLGNGKGVTSARVTQFDATLIKSASVNGTGANAQLVIGTPTRQDGSVQQTTVTVEVTFVDGAKETFRIPVTIYNPKLEIITVLSLNPQTSLYEQRLQVTNTTPYVIDSYRVVIPTLPAGVTLYSKSTQTVDGRPAVADTAPLQPGEKRVMIIEYFAPNVRQFPEPAVTLEINSVTSLPSPVGTTTAVDRIISAPNGRTYVEFTTAADKAYWVQYRDSATAVWQTSPVAVTGTGTTISWLDDGLPKTISAPTASRQYQLIVATATAAAAPLTIATQPETIRAAAGTSSTLSVRMQGTGPFTYQWYRDGALLPGATAASLSLNGLGLQNEGDYYAIVSDGRSVIQTTPAAVQLVSTNPARIVNLAVRANLDAGSDPLITGFVIEGTAVRPMLIRAVGPALRQFGLQTAAANTALKLYRGATVISENDDWELDVTPDVTRTTAASVGAFALPAKSADAALVRRLPASPYTIHTFNRGTAAGTVLVETYDGQAGYDANSRITNVSTRARLTAGDGALIAGLTIEGATTCRILARVVGPTLSTFGVTGTLADPTLQLFAANGTTVIATNDDWASVQSLVTSENLFRRVGAFDLPFGSKDSVIVTRLAPGSYTFVAQGKGAAEGQALIEIYLID